MAPSTIFLIEAGRATPRAVTARRLASALAVDPHEIDEVCRAIEAAKARGRRADGRGAGTGAGRGLLPPTHDLALGQVPGDRPDRRGVPEANRTVSNDPSPPRTPRPRSR